MMDVFLQDKIRKSKISIIANDIIMADFVSSKLCDKENNSVRKGANGLLSPFSASRFFGEKGNEVSF